MAVPKRRQSRSRAGMRRSHDQYRIKVLQLAACPRCGAMKPTHVVCPNENCGHYMGRAIVEAN